MAHGFSPAEIVVITRTSIFCPFTQRVNFVLKEKNAAFRIHDIGSDMPDWLKATNPTANVSVPVLFLRGEFVHDSTNIANRLDQEFTHPPLGSTDASVKEWVQYVNAELQPTYGKNMMGSAPNVQKEEQPKLVAALQKVDAQVASSGGPYLFGNKITLADVLLAPPLSRLDILHKLRGFDAHERLPSLRQLMDAIFARPAWQEVAYDQTTMLKYFRKTIPRLPPLSSNRLQHQAIRARTARLVDSVNSLSTSDSAAVQRLRREIDELNTLDEVHARFEDVIMFPLVESLSSAGQMRGAVEEHHALDRLLAAVRAKAAGLDNSATREAAHAELQPLLTSLKDLFWKHCATEEANGLALVANLERPKSQDYARQIYELAPKEVQDRVSIIVLESITLPEAEQYVHNVWEAFKDAKPEVWTAFIANLKKNLKPQLLAELQERLADVIPNFAAA